MKSLLLLLMAAICISAEIEIYETTSAGDKVVESMQLISDNEILSIKADKIGTDRALLVKFTGNGPQKVKTITTKNLKRSIWININGVHVSSPYIAAISEFDTVIGVSNMVLDLTKFEK